MDDLGVVSVHVELGGTCLGLSHDRELCILHENEIPWEISGLVGVLVGWRSSLQTERGEWTDTPEASRVDSDSPRTGEIYILPTVVGTGRPPSRPPSGSLSHLLCTHCVDDSPRLLSDTGFGTQNRGGWGVGRHSENLLA